MYIAKRIRVPILLSVLVISISLVFAQDGKYWVQKVYGGGLGDPFAYNPKNPNTVFCAPGSNQIWRSFNRGRTWHMFATLYGGNQIKAIHINPLDTLQMIVGQESGPPDRIMKTTDGGLNWYPTWYGEYSYYGRPLAYEPAHPNLVYAEGWDSLWRSTDFGETWKFVRVTLNMDTLGGGGLSSGFDRWDCAVIRPDSPSVMYVGDVTNGLWKTYDSGYTWVRKHYHSGEYPIMAIDPFNPMIAYSAQWIGNRGFIKTTDGGESWFYIDSLAGRNTWGMAVSKLHPGFVCTGTYGDALTTIGGIYLSYDYGANWIRTYQGLTNGSNYGMLAIDSLSVFALQANGIWRMEDSNRCITLISPNGGEGWVGSMCYNIKWSSKNVSTVKIEYTTNNGLNWIGIASLIPAAVQDSYRWTVPITPSNDCRIKVSDDYYTQVSDISDTTFTILFASIKLNSPNGGEVLKAGTVFNITWSDSNVSHIKLFYSTDSGNSWITIISNYPTSTGFYPWNVPFTPSANCKFKVSHNLYDAICDVSDTLFTIATIKQFVNQIVLEDNGNLKDTLLFGEMGGASDGIDQDFGEFELLPKPGIDTFDVRWKIEGTNGVKKDIRDTLSTLQQVRVFTMELQAGPAGFPFTIKWDPEMLPSGSVFLRDELTHGDSINFNMLNDSVFLLTNPNLSNLQVVHKALATSLVSVFNRWNIVSIPLLLDNRVKTSIFPTAISNAYEYSKGYIIRDTLMQGKGYWLKFSGAQIIPLTGVLLLSDSVTVVQGWNMIGGLSYPVPVSSIAKYPEDIQLSYFYGYRNGYILSDTIYPGKGYWVKVNKDGKLIFNTNMKCSNKVPFEERIAEYDKLVFTDSRDYSQTLYYVVGNIGKNIIECSEMPPPPPEGIFNARFTTNKMFEVISNTDNREYSILLSSVEYPLYINWETKHSDRSVVLLIDNEEIPLKGYGVKKVYESKSKLSLKLKEPTDVPKSYKLECNYPNPFNPITIIRYQLPVESKVTLKVFNVLGQEVRTLVNTEQKAGNYEIVFDASNLPTGVYFYSLQTKNYTEVKKALMIK